MQAIFDWCVVGNGPIVSKDLPLARHTIGFNKPLAAPFNAIVHNNKEIGLSKSIGLHTECGLESVLPKLIDTALTLEAELGCWPSLGLTVVTTGVGLNLRLSVQRMDLLPSIARPSTLASNTPLAASFHNWLAERRYALTLLKDLDWPQYMMTLNVEPLVEFHNQSNCLNELLSLPNASKEQAKNGIDFLYNIPLNAWVKAVLLAKDTDIVACDSLFVLSRTSHQTVNWWLYDYTYSIKMNAIRTRLALAQAHHYASTLFLS